VDVAAIELLRGDEGPREHHHYQMGEQGL
jgi:hypothetical protein